MASISFVRSICLAHQFICTRSNEKIKLIVFKYKFIRISLYYIIFSQLYTYFRPDLLLNEKFLFQNFMHTRLWLNSSMLCTGFARCTILLPYYDARRKRFTRTTKLAGYSFQYCLKRLLMREIRIFILIFVINQEDTFRRAGGYD